MCRFISFSLRRNVTSVLPGVCRIAKTVAKGLKIYIYANHDDTVKMLAPLYLHSLHIRFLWCWNSIQIRDKTLDKYNERILHKTVCGPAQQFFATISLRQPQYDHLNSVVYKMSTSKVAIQIMVM